MASAALGLARQRCACKNPLDDIGARRWSLEFANAETEAAFAAGLSTELARDIALCTAIIIFVYTIYFSIQIRVLPEYYSSPSVNAFPVVMLIHATIISGCIVNLAIAAAQIRCHFLSPRSFEVVFACACACCLMMIPFTEQASLFSLFGDLEEAKRTAPLSLGVNYLLVDCVITIVSLMPLRWSTIWPVYLLAMFWCPMIRYSIVGSLEGHMHAIATQVLLTMLGASGSRTLERHVRRLFFTVTTERTKRARSEFLLEQQDPTVERPRAPSTEQRSIDTGAIFESPSEPLDIDLTLRRIEGVAMREQWLIKPQDIKVHTKRFLGRGSFGAVVTGTLSGLPVAVKLPIGKVRAESLRDLAVLISELRVFRKLRHPNIAMFIGAVIDISLRELAVVMEVVVGPDLHQFVKAPSQFGGALCDRSMYSLLCGMARALQYLHSLQPCIVHGDLKPKNVLVGDADSSTPCAKLVDFGLSRILAGNVRPLGGTLRWVPPELMEVRTAHRAVDVFSFGQLAYFVIAGAQPFDGWSKHDISRALHSRRVSLQMPPEHASPCVLRLSEIAQDCSVADAPKRPTMSSVCDDLVDLAEVQTFQELLGKIKDKLWYGYAKTDDAEELGKPESANWEHAILDLQRQLRRGDLPGGGSPLQAAAAAPESIGKLGAQGGGDIRQLHVSDAVSIRRGPCTSARAAMDLRGTQSKDSAVCGRKSPDGCATGTDGASAGGVTPHMAL